MKKLMKINYVILIVLLITILLGFRVEKKNYGSKNFLNKIYHYGFNNQLVKTVDLKTKKIIYQNSWKAFFDIVERDRFLFTETYFDSYTKFYPYVNALPTKMIMYDSDNQNQEVGQIGYEYNKKGLLKRFKSDFNALDAYVTNFICFYNKQGIWIKTDYFSFRTLERTTTEEYRYEKNKRGFISEVKLLSNNKLLSQKKYKYTHQGLVTEITCSSRSFDTNQIHLQEREEYFYDQQKRLIEIKAYPYGGDMKHQKKFLKSRYSYNPEGLIIKKDSYDHQEQLKEYWQYQYNEKGLLISEKRFSKEGQYQDETKLEYDELDRLSQESWYNGVKLKSMKKYIY